MSRVGKSGNRITVLLLFAVTILVGFIWNSTWSYAEGKTLVTYPKWSKVEIDFFGPASLGMGEPNPFQITAGSCHKLLQKPSSPSQSPLPPATQNKSNQHVRVVLHPPDQKCTNVHMSRYHSRLKHWHPSRNKVSIHVVIAEHLPRLARRD